MALPRLTEQQLREDPEQQLKNFKRGKDFLVAIDTDGCVTDNMNGKQMRIFSSKALCFSGRTPKSSIFHLDDQLCLIIREFLGKVKAFL